MILISHGRSILFREPFVRERDVIEAVQASALPPVPAAESDTGDEGR